MAVNRAPLDGGLNVIDYASMRDTRRNCIATRRVPGTRSVLGIVLIILAACDLEFRSGWFEDEWQTEFRGDLIEPIIARGVECEKVRYRRSTKWRDSYLVECSIDGEKWDEAFLVWPKDGIARRR